MAQISVTINARQYRMACADGQEDHLTRLAIDVDQRIQAMRNQFGEVGDMRLTIMGAITIADELADANNRIRLLEQELMSMRDARQVAVERGQAAEAAFLDVIASTAERIENATRGLIQSPPAARA
ncbi:MAG: cell division protein ZapA [Xanthobacteraceae bacterium]